MININVIIILVPIINIININVIIILVSILVLIISIIIILNILTWMLSSLCSHWNLQYQARDSRW